MPRKGDFVALSFDPQAGHEQKGRRPALVVSNTLFNKHTGMAMVCPVTNTRRNNPFHVALEGCPDLTGHVMTEQIKSVDFKSRGAAFISKAPESLLEEVLAILDACLFDPPES